MWTAATPFKEPITAPLLPVPTASLSSVCNSSSSSSSSSLHLSQTQATMLSRRRVTFFLGGEESVERRSTTKSDIREGTSLNSSSTSAYPTGLRILIERSRGQPNILCKSTMTWKKHRPITDRAQHAPSFTSEDFKYQSLTKCHLCHKRLSSNKDIFMYRGDQGFCSEECRSRQIFLDEMKEIETSTKTILSSSSASSPCRSTNKRVREFGRRRLI